MDISKFYLDKKVLVTGHTGFKGAWLCKILDSAGAKVAGFALEPPTNPSLFEIARVADYMDSGIGDIRDFDALEKAFHSFEPEIVFHLAAQPLVRESYKDPRYTYETNVIGTVNVLECVRSTESVRSFINITTDKVYYNSEWAWGYRETDPLDGYDPYSNSKSCSELVTHSYKSSFFADRQVAISTARAGNVIGGGDFSVDRIIPDCVRAIEKGQPILIRNPHSTRPYQHVLEPLFAYLMIAQKQFEDVSYAGYYNVGPDDCDCVSTAELVDMMCALWGEGLTWETHHDGGPHEAGFLKLDCSRLKRTFSWQPNWGITKALDKTVEWTKAWLAGEDPVACMERQISDWLEAR